MPFAFVYSPALLFINFTWVDFSIALASSVVAVMGLGAAYTGYVGRPIGRLAFIALNLLSVSLIFANPTVSAIAIPCVVLLLWWHRKSAHTPSGAGAPA